MILFISFVFSPGYIPSSDDIESLLSLPLSIFKILPNGLKDYL